MRDRVVEERFVPVFGIPEKFREGDAITVLYEGGQRPRKPLAATHVQPYPYED